MAATPITFQKWLETRRVEKKGAPCSMTAMRNGRWMIEDKDYPEFFDKLHNHLFVQKKAPMNLVEQRRSDKYSPLLIDLDFRYSPEQQLTRRFNDEHIGNFIAGLTSVLVEFFDLNDYDNPRFFVTLRPAPYQDKKYHDGVTEKINKDGIHIICPDIVMHSDQQKVLRLILLDRNIISECFEGTEYINSDEDVYDKTIAAGTTGWLFYGESKPDLPPYEITAVYECNTQKGGKLTFGNIKDYDNRDLMEMFSIRYNLLISELVIREDKKDEWTSYTKPAPTPVATPLPKNNIVKGGGAGDVDSDDEILTHTDTINETVSAHLPKFLRDVPDLDDGQIEFAKRFALECLSAERMDNYTTWKEVGWCLHTIDPSPDMFQVYMECSAKSPKSRFNNVSKLRAEWDSPQMKREAHENKLTIKSLRWWAKNDNLKRYNEINDDDIIDKVMRGALECNHHHVAKIMKHIFGDNYVSSPNSRTVDWFEYVGHVWSPIPQSHDIRAHISDRVVDIIQAARNRLKPALATVNPSEFKTSPEFQRINELLKFERKLYDSGFKSGVLKECEEQFRYRLEDRKTTTRRNQQFFEILNMNPFLLGCANGILNLRAGPEDDPHVEFRAGRPEDLVSYQVGKTTGLDPIPYVPYDPTDPIYEEIDDFMEKIFPDESLRKYTWLYFASLLEGQNTDQEFYIWTGRGGNGKSKITELLAKTLGEYAVALPSTTITRKSADPGAASPEFLMAIGKRLIYMQELEEGEAINTSLMKKLTGGDEFVVRGLFKDPIIMKIMGKIMIQCNKLPPINSMDGGTKRRIRVEEFISRFKEPSSPEIDASKHVYPIDYSLDKKILAWRTPFFSKLVHIYNTEFKAAKYSMNPAPPIVKAAITEYLESYDSFAKFKNNCLRIGGKAVGAETTFREISRAYSTWYADQGQTSGAKKLNDIDLKNKLREELGRDPILVNKREVFMHVRVFMSLDDAQAWEAEA